MSETATAARAAVQTGEVVEDNADASQISAGFSFEQLEPSPPPPRDAAERALAQAVAAGEQIRAQARTEGYAEGRAEGHQDGTAQTTAAALAMGEALRELHELRAQIAVELERDAVELALALAAKILAGAFEAEPERVVDVVRGALRRVADRRQIVVLVDPEDLEIVSSAVGKLQAQAGGIELCDVQADRRVGRGGAVVRTAEGEIDVTVETQLQRARELLLALPDAESAA
ncbi:MAG TPA: FliH/SctL family protein [Solirubrobacteraceae bacterium]|nr:FliH/SctL family protein [Solirubrobacteraceae bacterium]